MARPRSHLLNDVLLALGRAEVIEQLLVAPPDEGLNVLGLAEGRKIFVNPLHNKRQRQVVGTLIHEAIHLVRTTWSEGKVRQAEREILAALTPADVKAIHTLYKKVVRKKRGVRTV